MIPLSSGGNGIDSELVCERVLTPKFSRAPATRARRLELVVYARHGHEFMG
jgi:hypothetical protein